MNQTEHAIDLMKQAVLLGPEGEHMDLEGGYTLDEIIRIKAAIGSLRKAGELVNRALAQAWHTDYPGQEIDDEWNVNFLGFATKRTWQDGQAEVFANWLKSQDTATIMKVVGAASKVGVSGVPRGVRDSVFDEEVTDDELRIKNRPRSK